MKRQSHLRRKIPLRPTRIHPATLTPEERQAELERFKAKQKAARDRKLIRDAKTRQQASTPPKRTSLRPVSRKRAASLVAYRAMLTGARTERAPCELCRADLPWEALEPHHPFGRHGANLLRVVMLCHRCHHERIHGQPAWAHAAGWLQPEFSRKQPDPTRPRPWQRLIEG